MKNSLYQIQDFSLEKMIEHWKGEIPMCETDFKGEALSFHKIVFMFLILFIGFISAIMIFVCEIIKSRLEVKGITVRNQHEEIIDDIETLIKSITKSNVSVRVVIERNTEE